MPAREKKPAEKPKQEWMLTYGDVVTLLLTFFVLLLAMSSMDQSFVSRVSIFTSSHGALANKAAGKAPTRVQMVLEMIERPWEAFHKEQKIKDLLFPDAELPPEIDRKTLNENMQVFARNEGLALVFSDRLLFGPGGAVLAEPARAILAQVVPLLLHSAAPVNVAGFTDAEEGRTPGAFALSEERAAAVLDFFLAQGVAPLRFSLSAYGPDRPLAENSDEEGRARNRRVEVFLKTSQPLGGYLTQ